MEEPAEDLVKDCVKDVVYCSSEVSGCIEPMDTESNTTNTNDSEASTSAAQDQKPSSPLVVASQSAICSSISPPASGRDLKQSEEIKEDDIKEEENDDKASVETSSKCDVIMELGQIKSELIKEIKKSGETPKPTRPSSTPPSNAGTADMLRFLSTKQFLCKGTLF